MEKHSNNQMDLDEWEVLSEDGFFELHHHDTRSSNKVLTIDSGSDDYFICPSPKKSAVKSSNQLVPVTTIQLEPKKKAEEEEEQIVVVVKEMIKVPIVEMIKTPKLVVLVGDDDQDTIPQVFFKKIKDKEEEEEEEVIEAKKIDDDQAAAAAVKNYSDSDMKKKEERNGLQIWNWRITGIGALCSIGITICIFIIIGNRRKKKNHQQKNQKYRIQIYAQDQRIKHVVHHATKLNHAIAAARGVPLTGGHITFGGYFDGL